MDNQTTKNDIMEYGIRETRVWKGNRKPLRARDGSKRINNDIISMNEKWMNIVSR